MTRVVLSVGANLGDRLAALTGCVDALGPALRAASPVYETDPWGPVPQPDYLNAVLLADDPDRDAAGWLAWAHRRERAAGRIRDQRWGPRTLDVDLVQVYDGDQEVRSDDPALTLPHPRAHERAFVLLPWRDVQPDATLAGHGPVTGLVAAMAPEQTGSVRRTDHALRGRR
jgi:2-amino-4-hydroxy-6-hydroxymethyldihydropteridine diphosphokinase